MLSDLLFRLRAIFRRRDVERELDQELRFHIEHEAAKYERSGLSADEALRRARLALDGPEQVRENCRDARGMRWLEDLARDLRYAGRILRQSPVFAAAAVLSLGLGIGANTAIFTVIDALKYKPLPVAEPSRLVAIQPDSLTYRIWAQIRDRQDVFSALCAYSAETFDSAGGGERRPVRGLYVSGDYFRTLGVTPLIGRALSGDDDRRGSPTAATAVLSYAFWQKEFAGHPNVLGQSIRLDNLAFTIAGVMPRGFFGLDVGDAFDVAIPLNSVILFTPNRDVTAEPFHWWLAVVGRLKPELSLAQAKARLGSQAAAIYAAAMPGAVSRDPGGQKLSAVPLTSAFSEMRDRYATSLNLLMGIAGLVLLIACANIANLLLARAGSRRREIAVRLALGAGRGRLARQLLTESVLLSLAGGVAGVFFARWGAAILVASVSSLRQPHFLDLSIDVRILVFTLAAAIVTGLAFGIAPALRTVRTSPFVAIKQGGRGLTERHRGWSLSRVLVCAQVAISLLLLAAAGLFTASLRALLHQDMGFRPDGVLLLDANFGAGRAAQAEQVVRAQELENRLAAVPGIEAAGRSSETPLSGGTWQWDVRVDTAAGGAKDVHIYANLATPGYFAALGTPLLAGRVFAPRDSGGPKVAIVNQSAARLLFGTDDPIGHTYRDHTFDSKSGKYGPYFSVEIVGLVKDAKYNRVRDTPPPTIYIPITEQRSPRIELGTFELRFTGPAAGAAARVRTALREFDPKLPYEMHLLAEQIDDALQQERLMARLATFFGLLALLLVSMGLYGVVAYSVARRRNEIGLRVALGASRGSVIWLVLRDLGTLLLAGTCTGLAAAVACSRLLGTMLYHLRPNDPATLAAAALLLLLVAGAAGYLPARRAARLDPTVALRED